MLSGVIKPGAWLLMAGMCWAGFSSAVLAADAPDAAKPEVAAAAAPAEKVINIFGAAGRKEIAGGASEECALTLPPAPQGKTLLLVFKARAQNPDLGGCTGFLQIKVNGKALTMDQVRERKARFTMAQGYDIPTVQGGAFTLYYAPNFNPIPEENGYYPVDLPGNDPFTFKLDLTKLVREGKNVITFTNVANRPGAPKVIIQDAALSGFPSVAVGGEAAGAAKPEAPAPAADAGALPYIAPKQVQPVPFAVELTKGGAVKVTLKEASHVITSDFSVIPGWAKLEGEASTGFEGLTATGDSLTAEAKGFTLSRKVTKHDECFEVADTLTNKTGDNLPVIVRHQVKIPDSVAFFLSGRRIYLKRGQSQDVQNPTTIVLTKDGSLGLLAMDDVFRAHNLSFAVNGAFGLADQMLVVKPKSSITMRLAVFPSEEKGYFDQINAMRRYLNVNFPVTGSNIWETPAVGGGWESPEGGHPKPKSALEWRTEFKYRSALYALLGRHSETEREIGVSLNGPDWLIAVEAGKVKGAEFWKNAIHELKQADPNIKTSLYFHAWFYALPDGKTRYPGCELLNPDGSQVNYGDVRYPMWIPVEGNAFARDLDKTLEFQTVTIPNEGVYWDEFSMSAADWHFGQPWDGVSADIDPQSHQISRLKSSTLLLTQPWREKAVRWLQDRKLYLITNSGPVTETLAKYHFLSFTETGSLMNCVKVQLYTPIALGDHLTEKNELDSYRWMLQCLNFGCVYYWYPCWPVTHPTLTSYMYPITPVELGEGYIIGKERIVTAKSGWFSLGDNAPVETHFFSADGVETPRDLSSEQKDGKTWYKVDLKEFESCALVRK